MRLWKAVKPSVSKGPQYVLWDKADSDLLEKYTYHLSSVQFSRWVMSDSATPWTAALQASLSPTLGVYSNSRPLSWCCHPTISMAPHSSTLAWKIPWTEEPGGLQSMGSRRVRHDRATSLSLFTFMHCGRKWQPTPVFLPGESQGWGSLVGCCLWGRTESDTTEAT